MKILIIGGGVVTKELLRILNLKKNQAVIVEKDPNKCADIGSKYDVIVINKDATDISIYTSDISMPDLDAVLALTDRDEVNVFALTIAKLYNIPLRLARVKDPKIAELIIQLGLGIPISVPAVTADLVKGYLESIREPQMLGVFGDYKLFRITITETDKVVGKSLKEVDLPPDTYVLFIFDGINVKIPDKDSKLLSGNQVMVLTKSDDIIKVFKG
ncbi:MAG: potassium transporter TrkA [Desulfurococcales archaeon ex4484_42]|nr:MAG: potassium transporter TrkA [Desulfurococcales archaeon ex4484_42]